MSKEVDQETGSPEALADRDAGRRASCVMTPRLTPHHLSPVACPSVRSLHYDRGTYDRGGQKART